MRWHFFKLNNQRGTSLVGAVGFVILTVILALGFLNIPVYNAQNVEALIDEAQAYWTIEAGFAIAHAHLQYQGAIDNSFIVSPNAELYIGSELIDLIPNIKIDRAKKAGTTTFTNAYRYRVTVGDDRMQVGNRRVKRHHQMVLEKTSYALYAYLSDIETKPDGTIIRFWTPDIIEGLTHSNDVIHMMQSPTFWGTVSTAQGYIDDYNADPIYLGEPQTLVNADSVVFPVQAEDLRKAAQRQGRFVTHNMSNACWVHLGGDFESSPTVVTKVLLYDDEGEPFWAPHHSCTISQDEENAVFCDFDSVRVHGMVKGRLSVGSSGDMYLMDDVYYDYSSGTAINPELAIGQQPGKPDPLACQDYLGLISEGDIRVADIYWPGRIESSGSPYPSVPGFPNRSDITIAAGIVTLNESFTIQCGSQQGERGDIHMWGALAQKRRGVVHTIDECPEFDIHTGYGKDYHYDTRFQNWPPPFYLNTNSGKGGTIKHVLWTSEFRVGSDYGF